VLQFLKLQINFLLWILVLYIIELSLMSPCLHPVFGPGFTPPYPLFQWYLQSKRDFIESNLSMKCCNSVRNVQTQHLVHTLRD
jgi:hypothetical protein